MVLSDVSFSKILPKTYGDFFYSDDIEASIFSFYSCLNFYFSSVFMETE